MAKQTAAGKNFTKAQAEMILKLYTEIPIDIDICERWKKQMDDMYNPLGAMKYDGMPKATGTGDTTASLAIKIASLDTKAQIDFLNGRINELRKIATEIIKELLSMPVYHKSVIIKFYLEDKTWEQITQDIPYSVSQLKNIRTAALENLAKKVERNQYLSRSKIIIDYVA